MPTRPRIDIAGYHHIIISDGHSETTVVNEELIPWYTHLSHRGVEFGFISSVVFTKLCIAIPIRMG